MAGSGRAGRRLHRAAWLITGPLALLAVVCAHVVGLVAT